MSTSAIKICGRCNKPKQCDVLVEGEVLVLTKDNADLLENPHEFVCLCGRPTLYQGDKIMIAKVQQYLAKCVDEDYQLVKSDGDKATSYDNMVKVNIPTLEGFCLMLGINDDTLVEWRKIHKKFSAAVRKIELTQKQRLFNEGLAGRYNPMIAKLGLSANHGMKERTDVTSDDQKLSFGDFLDSIPKWLRNKQRLNSCKMTSFI